MNTTIPTHRFSRAHRGIESAAVAPRLVRFKHYALAMLMLVALAGATHAQDDAAMPQINLNTADAQALQYLPGVGPGKSAEIIRLREETGGFATMEDLLMVPGIGEKTLFGFAQYATLEGGISTLTEEMAENPPSADMQTHSEPAQTVDGGESIAGSGG
ncbi:MAG: ComEA family DNA-binding protein [bacterium]